MTIKIYKPSKTAMQSGIGKTKQWLAEYISDEETTIKPEAKDVVNETNSVNNLDLIKKSPRELAIEHQNKLKKKSKDKNLS